MSKNKAKKVFTEEEKVAIIEACKLYGVTKTLEKYGVYPATYYDWKKKYAALGSEGLKDGRKNPPSRELKALQKENDQLKKLLGEKELLLSAYKDAREKP